MVIDSSSLMAIVLVERDAYVYAEAISQASADQAEIYIPASVLVEAGIIAEQRNRNEQLDTLLGSLKFESYRWIVPSPN
ncbi:MAG: type II toxin-antitoxin system VapC family toxin [Acidobacteriaceae bacterium]|nr:type II toxin-antitoxin system VapC family toxin [Acidobacteriaceae bacterium]